MVDPRLAEDLPASHRPADRRLVMAPRLIELCFQTAGIWEMGTTGRMGLPSRVGRVSVLRSPEEAEGRLHAVVWPGDHAFDASVVDEAGNVFVVVEGYSTVELPGPIDEEKLAPLKAAMRRSDGA